MRRTPHVWVADHTTLLIAFSRKVTDCVFQIVFLGYCVLLAPISGAEPSKGKLTGSPSFQRIARSRVME